MTSPLLAFAAAIVRVWTRLYTWGFDPVIRDERRAEIESDIWEQAHAPDARRVALQILGRMFLGVPDDIHWRREHTLSAAASPRYVLFATLASVLLFATVWMVALRRTPPRPWLPPPAAVNWVREPMTAPPPPPPPICSPVNRQPVCTPWP